MRVALLCHASLGGSSRVATRLGCALERLGHSVSLVSASRPPAPAKELSAIRLEPFEAGRTRGWTTVIEPTWDTWRLAALERRVEAVIRRDRVEVVHYHYAWPFAHIVPRLKARLGLAAPVFVGTLHGTDVTRAPTDAFAALRFTDVYTTVSQTYAHLARERLVLAHTPLVIPNFVDLDDFTPSFDFTHVRAQRAKPRLVHVSNYRQVKNPQGVADIFVALRTKIPAELWLVGEGPGLQELTTTLDRAGVGADVRVLGYRSDIGQVLAECDLLLMTSWEESFCLAVLEAMTCGLSVVATAVGGLTELAEHGQTAMLYQPGDHREGARLALHLLTHDDLRLRMRRFAARHARTFSAGSVVRRYEALYRSACSSLRSLEEPLAIEAV
ncbi:MAG: glycosyltransferase [Verrucomicrobiota bacterium]